MSYNYLCRVATSTLFPLVLFVNFLYTLIIVSAQKPGDGPPLQAPFQGHVPQRQQYPDFHKRFEYKHSFRAPHLAQKDGSIPFWTIKDDAIASGDLLRLAPSMTSKAGSVWNYKQMVESESWIVEMSLKISGRGRIGADGLALWYRTDIPQERGPVFGSSETWVGLGLFFDSFDNDYNRDAPFVGIMINDGKIKYEQAKDGGENNIRARCQKDFRNRPFPVKARIEYVNNVLTVYIHNGNAAQDQFDLCIKEEKVYLPKNGFFGLSAATGGLADDHDVMSFEVWSMNPSRPQPPAMMPVEEQRKIEEEYKKQDEAYKQNVEKYQKEHPDKAMADEEARIKTLQDPLERDILSIFEGQSSIFNVLQQMDAKINQLSGQQQSLIQLANQQAGRPAGAPIAAVPGGDGLQRSEATELVHASREVTVAVRDIKNLVADLQNRIIMVDQRLTSHQQPPTSQIAGSASQGDVEYQKANLDVIRREVEQIRLQQRAQVITCPAVDSGCLSSTLFIIIIVTQSTLFFVYTVYRGRNEKAKFY